MLGVALAAWTVWALWRRHQKDKQRRRERYQEWQANEPVPNLYGDERLASGDDIRAGGAFEDQNGIPIGYFDSKPIYHNGPTSLITFGRSGEGKGSQAIIPALLQCPNTSFVIPDIDGEAFCVTAEQRARYGKIVVLDPYHIFDDVLRKIERGRYNPIGDWLEPNHPQFWPRCARITSGVIPRGEAKEQYWNLGSRQITTDFIGTLRKYGTPNSANLTRVAELINGDAPAFARYVSSVVNDPLLRARLSRWANPSAMDIRSLPEVLENTKTMLNPWLDESVAYISHDSTFNFSQCAEQVMTVYMLAPHELLEAGGVSKWLTTMNMCATTELIRFNPNRTVQTVFVWDEFFELPFEHADHLLVSARKAKTSIWIIMQDLSELRDLYPKTFMTFLSSVGCVQWLSASDAESASLVSQALGKRQVVVNSKSRSYSAHAGVSDPPTWLELKQLNQSFNQSVMARDVMLPQEVAAIPKDQQILFLRSVAHPILAGRRSYLDVPALRQRAGVNPYYNNSQIPGVPGIPESKKDNWMRLLA